MSENEIQRSLGRIEGGQTEVLKQLETIAARINKHEDHIEKLNAFKNKALGFCAIVGLFTSLFVQLIKQKFFDN